MKKIKVTAVLFLLVFALSACKSYYESLFRTQDLEERFRGAMYFYNNGKFRKAASLFESMLFLSQGTDKEDSVQFYNALSNYRYGDYITAEANFNKFLEVFPRSAMSEEAKFLRIKCLYEGTYRWELDQVPTQKAMATIAEFMYDNPSSEYYDVCKAMMDEFGERLDRKAYESAKLYYTMKDYKSSHYALKSVLRDNSDNRYREEILYYTAMSSYKYAFNSIREKQKERYMTFIDDYYNFIGEYPRVSERKELDQMFIRAQKYVGLKGGLDSAQVAAAAEVAKIDAVTPDGAASKKNIRADRKNTKRAIKEAKKAVKEAESRSAVARKVNEETSGTQKQNQRRKERQERAEAMKIYEQAKAKAKEEKEKKQDDNKNQ
ncbi:MAG: outer membrane protein assembly factor BamD [Bacteroidales bacterium]|nr:outer membrane protein assembly factor BamD [Bacteroidales bacterium]MBQ2483423.1 outer membrane protein assembly factor BamD [Bacteroidales bacterium]MBQ2492964.1 outer membrane protein assembly factor BamD [Bacteroidales bacterium]MBQ4196908.1 outer membrane protein assembly factor BamD [Bacteroidales bacterium]